MTRHVIYAIEFAARRVSVHIHPYHFYNINIHATYYMQLCTQYQPNLL